MTAIVWFRDELSLNDQPALTAALRSEQTIIPLYNHAPQQVVSASDGRSRRIIPM
ncbi:MAG: deoxyribodipyrimidine photo-lyase [Gammaproteobacteria bacterium]|nr:deoxyribodipyrimidine photo-lyase [Gammaproteobacteria bacterium]